MEGYIDTRSQFYAQPTDKDIDMKIQLEDNMITCLQTHIVVGGWLLLHAARPIWEGQEVTTSFIGTGRFRHVAERRAQLQQQVQQGCWGPFTAPPCPAALRGGGRGRRARLWCAKLVHAAGARAAVHVFALSSNPPMRVHAGL